MCFSAGASFSASFLLALIGCITIKYSSQRLRVFAATPLLFSVQQSLEGILWLLNGVTTTTLGLSVMYGFLFFAYMFWPLWLPINLLILEKNYTRRCFLWFTVAAGSFLAVFSLLYMILYGATAAASGCHIAYATQPISPISFRVAQLCYGIALVLPCLISTIRYMWLLGGGAALSYFMTSVLFPNYIPSVWCFFGALISSVVLVIVITNKNE